MLYKINKNNIINSEGILNYVLLKRNIIIFTFKLELFEANRKECIKIFLHIGNFYKKHFYKHIKQLTS